MHVKKLWQEYFIGNVIFHVAYNERYIMSHISDLSFMKFEMVLAVSYHCKSIFFPDTLVPYRYSVHQNILYLVILASFVELWAGQLFN